MASAAQCADAAAYVLLIVYISAGGFSGTHVHFAFRCQ